MKIKHLWTFKTYDHIYDLQVTDEVALVSGDKFVRLDLEGGVKEIIELEQGLYCLRKVDGGYVVGGEARTLFFLTDEPFSVETPYGVYSCDVGAELAVGTCCGLVLIGKRKIQLGGHVYALRWLKDGYLAVGNLDGRLSIIKDYKVVWEVKETNGVNAISPCGDYLAVGTFEPGYVYLYDVSDPEAPKLVWKREGFDVRALAWKEGCDKLFAGDFGRRAAIFDLEGNVIIGANTDRGVESAEWKGNRIYMGLWGRLEVFEVDENEGDTEA